jgi:uncharacterized protein (UPF0335 family)
VQFVDELSKIEESKSEFRKAERDLLLGAAVRGLHKGALKDVVKRKTQTCQEAEKRHAREDAFDSYLKQLGMHADPPPQQAASARHARA